MHRVVRGHKKPTNNKHPARKKTHDIDLKMVITVTRSAAALFLISLGMILPNVSYVAAASSATTTVAVASADLATAAASILKGNQQQQQQMVGVGSRSRSRIVGDHHDTDHHRALAGCSGLYSATCSSSSCPGILSECDQACNAGGCSCKSFILGNDLTSFSCSGGGSSGGGGAAPNPCVDGYTAIWLSPELQAAHGSALQNCVETIDDTSVVLACAESDQLFENACAAQGGVPQYLQFSHQCSGITILYQGFPMCSNPLCTETETEIINQSIEDGFIEEAEGIAAASQGGGVGPFCTDNPNPPPVTVSQSSPPSTPAGNGVGDSGSNDVGNGGNSGQTPLTSQSNGSSGYSAKRPVVRTALPVMVLAWIMIMSVGTWSMS